MALPGFGGDADSYFNMAVLLILDHQISQVVRVLDVVPYMVGQRTLTDDEAQHIVSGATSRIQTERLVARVKVRGIPGYLQLRAALAACGPKYEKLIATIDTNIPPQYSNNAMYY
ncbi:uncharacterized protein [Diadema setosum]|uniref:uncharacterized protein n=1 Tax=Diadema setosum TaxID=31175 RepID=UPI003B3A7254